MKDPAIEKLKEKQENAHKKIRELYHNSAGLDGIIDVPTYVSSKLKVCWILKERNFPVGKEKQEYNLMENMRLLAQCGNWKRTYGNICLVTSGILEWTNTKNKNFLNFENLPELKVEKDENNKNCNVFYDNQNERIYPIDYIAFLNTKKQGVNNTKSKQCEINNEYRNPKVKLILKEQIAYINADVIILGNRVEQMVVDFSGVSSFKEFDHLEPYNFCKYYFNEKQKKLYIYTYHPNARKKKKDYCNSIFNIVKQYEYCLLKA